MSAPRRVCLLTGAGGVLGDAFCARMAGRYDVVAVHRGRVPLVSTQDRRLIDPLAPGSDVEDAGARVFAVQADLLEPGALRFVVELALARFGRVDLLLNAAADVAGTAPLTDPRCSGAWRDQLLLNAVVPVELAAELAQSCWQGDERVNRRLNRHVLNVSSTAGLGAAPGRGRGFYGASKAALNVLTRQMAAEYELMGVRVNALAPTFFPDLVPLPQVLAAIERLETEAGTGRVLVLEKGRSRWL